MLTGIRTSKAPTICPLNPENCWTTSLYSSPLRTPDGSSMVSKPGMLISRPPGIGTKVTSPARQAIVSSSTRSSVGGPRRAAAISRT